MDTLNGTAPFIKIYFYCDEQCLSLRGTIAPIIYAGTMAFSSFSHLHSSIPSLPFHKPRTVRHFVCVTKPKRSQAMLRPTHTTRTAIELLSSDHDIHTRHPHSSVVPANLSSTQSPSPPLPLRGFPWPVPRTLRRES